jgi:hypothetical protein
MGGKVYYANSDFWSMGGFIGYRGSFAAGNFGLMPYGRIGFDYLHDQEYEDYKDLGSSFDTALGFSIVLMGQAGLKVTSTYVPGLFVGAAFQYNFFDLYDKDYDKVVKKALSFTAGYAF